MTGTSATGRQTPGDSPTDLGPLLEQLGLSPQEVLRGSGGETVVTAFRPATREEVVVQIGPRLRRGAAVRRFADVTARLGRIGSPPFLVPIVASGTTPRNRHPWIVTPRLPGGNLGGRVSHQGPLMLEEVLRAGRHAAGALDALHAGGMVHGRCRPEHLLVDATGLPWLDRPGLDGLDDPQPASSGPDLLWLPPEVLEGDAWTPAGDLWALGATLFALLQGRPPWSRTDTGSRAARLMEITSGAPTRADRAPAWLADLLGACLAADPAGRTARAGELAAALAQGAARTETLPPVASVADAGQALGSGYVLLDRIGSGSSGSVWRARRRDGQMVAAKVLRPELSSDPHSVVRFLRERTAHVGISDPNLVTVLDLVAEGSTLAIIMELVDGTDLRRLLPPGQAVPVPVACRILAEVSAGLEAIHRAGIVHRDLKPENVMIEANGGGDVLGGRVRLTDFGIARATTATALTGMDQLLGTADYLAPEVIAGRPTTPAADIYGLGIMAYEMLKGGRPFTAEHPAALLHAHLSVEPDPLALPEPLWSVISACLSKDPEDRPGAAEVGARLRPLIGVASPGPPRQMPPAAGSPMPEVAPTRNVPFARPATSPAPPVLAPPVLAPPVLAAAISSPPDLVRDADGPPTSPTKVYASPLRRELPEPPAETVAKRWPRHRTLLAVLAVALVGGGGGLAYGLTRHSPTPVDVTADVTTGVSVSGPGEVTVTWRAVASEPGFSTYLLVQDGSVPVSQLPATPDSYTFHGVNRGNHCFRVAAVFRSRLPAGVTPTSHSAECVEIP